MSDDLELVKRLREAHARVSLFPENRGMDGFMDLLALRNEVPAAADAIEALTAEVDALKEQQMKNAANAGRAVCEVIEQKEKAEAEAARLREGITQFIAYADNAPKRIIGSGVGGQTMEETLKRAGRLVSEWHLGQLEEALRGEEG